MAKYRNNFVPNPDQRSFGVLLVNLGTPKSPESSSVRRFLRQFLSDQRVVELPKAIWWFILHGIILTIRPRRSAAAYQKVWMPDGSPLLVNATKQAERLEAVLQQNGIQNGRVQYAMRYGEPSVARALDELTESGIDRVLIIPMYPQYSGSTTGSVFDDVGDSLKRRRFVPSLRFMNGYACDERYIHSLQVTVREHWIVHGKSDKLVMSFHGLPQAFCDQGDPYFQQCTATASALAAKLDLDDTDWTLCFQSRVGAAPWLRPYADEVISNLPNDGVTRIDMICPGFSVDCLETLEEVAIGYKELFLKSGGESFQFIPCLNDHPEHIEMLSGFVRDSVSDWIHSE